MRKNNDLPPVSGKFHELLAVLAKMSDQEILEAEGHIQLHIAMRFSGAR